MKPKPETLTREQLARRLKISIPTVRRYLAMDGAPAPGRDGRFDAAAVAAFIRDHAPRVGDFEGAVRKQRTRLLDLRCQQLEHELAVQRGEFVKKSEIEPAIVRFNSDLTQNLQDKFERELPSRCVGKTVIEIEQMNAAAIDWVLTRLKEGQRPVMTEKQRQSVRSVDSARNSKGASTISSCHSSKNS